MRTNRYILIFSIFSIIFIILFITISAEGKEAQLFDDIIEITQGNVEEVGIRLTFNTEENGKKS